MIKLLEGEEILARGQFGFKVWEIIGMIFLSLVSMGAFAILFYIDYSRTKKQEVILTNKRLVGKFRAGWQGYKIREAEIPLEEIKDLKMYTFMGMNSIIFKSRYGQLACGHLRNIKEFSSLSAIGK